MTPGSQTSEYRLTAVAILIGTLLETAVVPLLHVLTVQHPASIALAITLIVVGAFIQVAGLFGYQKSRATVKAAAAPYLNATLPPGFAAALDPSALGLAKQESPRPPTPLG